MSNITISTINREAELLALFNHLIQVVSQVLDGLMWIIGNFGAICTCIVFSRPTFRKSPCAMYFTASSFSQLFVFNFAVFIRMIQYGYNVPVNSVPSWFCKLRFYIFYVAGASARYNIIFAAVDRFLCSCRSARLRRWSSSKVARSLIIIDAIIWVLFYIQILVLVDVTNDKCRIQVADIMKYFNFYLIIENGFLPIIPMLIFGLLTIRNIRQSRQRVKAMETTTGGTVSNTSKQPLSSTPRKEVQLHKMLINQVVVYVILNLPYPVYNIYRTYAGVSSFTGSRAAIDTFVNNLCFDMIYLCFALTFFNFLLTSSMFRRELKQMLCGYRQRIAPIS